MYLESPYKDHAAKDGEAEEIKDPDPPYLPLLPVCEEAPAPLAAPVAPDGGAVPAALHPLVHPWVTCDPFWFRYTR